MNELGHLGIVVNQPDEVPHDVPSACARVFLPQYKLVRNTTEVIFLRTRVISKDRILALDDTGLAEAIYSCGVVLRAGVILR